MVMFLTVFISLCLCVCIFGGISGWKFSSLEMNKNSDNSLIRVMAQCIRIREADECNLFLVGSSTQDLFVISGKLVSTSDRDVPSTLASAALKLVLA